MPKKVVLAYSGGLDTSFCVKYLSSEMNLSVHAALVDTGGFTEEELQNIEDRAYQMGVSNFTVLPMIDPYYQQCIKYLIFGNILRNQTYPMSVSAERMFQAIAIAEYANKLNTDFIAHGSTGAGNDQVRFDLAFQILGKNIEVITPIRDLRLSRKEEIDYLKERGIDLAWDKAKYSINKGLWGTSVGGVETLTSHQFLPEEAWPTPVTKTGSEVVTISFKNGEPVALNGRQDSPIEVIHTLQDLAQPYGIGRDVHVGDTIIGIKGRVGFEAAAPLILIKAHHLLEKHTLTKWEAHWKEQLAQWYGMFLHEGNFLDPVMRHIEKFLQSTQERVSGDVHVELAPYRFTCLGIESDQDLLQTDFGKYGEMNNAWTGEDVKGFTKVMSTALKIHSMKASNYQS